MILVSSHSTSGPEQNPGYTLLTHEVVPKDPHAPLPVICIPLAPPVASRVCPGSRSVPAALPTPASQSSLRSAPCLTCPVEQDSYAQIHIAVHSILCGALAIVRVRGEAYAHRPEFADSRLLIHPRPAQILPSHTPTHPTTHPRITVQLFIPSTLLILHYA